MASTRPAKSGLGGTAGMTLTEVLVSAAIGGVLMLTLATVVYTATFASKDYVDRLDTELELMRFEAVLRNVAQTAVDVRPAPGGVAAPGNGSGWIDTTFNSTNNGTMRTIGIFARENAKFARPVPATNHPVGNSDFYSTGIFFQAPSNDGRTAGVLMVDVGGAGATTVSPDYGDSAVGNIVSVDLRDPVTNDLGMLVGVTFAIEARYFPNRSPSVVRCFLPNISNCVNNLNPGMKVVRSFRLTFYNNDGGPSPMKRGVRERQLGRVYLFPMVGTSRSAFLEFE